MINKLLLLGICGGALPVALGLDHQGAALLSGCGVDMIMARALVVDVGCGSSQVVAGRMGTVVACFTIEAVVADPGFIKRVESK